MLSEEGQVMPIRTTIRPFAIARFITLALMMLGLLLADAAALRATHAPRHGDVCMAIDEPSFICGEVRVLLRNGYDIQTVLDACPPVGEVIESVDNEYVIAVPVDQEIAKRDCYADQAGVGQTNLTYVGQTTPPDTAALPRNTPAPTIAGLVLIVAGLGLVLLRRQGE
jgi:hypothetical protein